MSIVSSLLLFAILTGSAQCQSGRCSKVPLSTKTRWGGNQIIAIDLRDKPVRTVKGKVEGPGEGAISTLVQVFPRQPSDPLYGPGHQDNAKPVAACVTGDDGLFAFSLSSGEYELRMSQNVGVDVTTVFVKVERSSHSSEEITVVMHVGT